MELGNFSVSLAVKDIAASKAFYEKFGFTEFMGNAAQGWLILKNGDHVIGLFESLEAAKRAAGNRTVCVYTECGCDDAMVVHVHFDSRGCFCPECDHSWDETVPPSSSD
jgi:catechol 2,3-dioxygenase-like lactoylglutathione lyase family enzyme